MRKILLVALVALAGCGGGEQERSEERYRLVHAIGNAENVAARNLTKSECEVRRDELKQTASALGTFNEATGHGSITCLPESLFAG